MSVQILTAVKCCLCNVQRSTRAFRTLNKLYVNLRGRRKYSTDVSITKNCRVSFCDGSFLDDSLLRPLSIRTEHSRLVVYHCRNSSVFFRS